MAHLMATIPLPLQRAALWLSQHEPRGVPRMIYAVLIVLAGWALGRFGSKIIATLVQLALIAASVIVAYDLLRV